MTVCGFYLETKKNLRGRAGKEMLFSTLQLTWFLLSLVTRWNRADARFLALAKDFLILAEDDPW